MEDTTWNEETIKKVQGMVDLELACVKVCHTTKTAWHLDNVCRLLNIIKQIEQDT